MSKKSTQVKTKYSYNDIYVTIPSVIYDNNDLNATDKIVLALIHGYKSTWNSIKTETIAEYLNLETATINKVIRKLVFLGLIEERYYLARRRVFRSLLEKTDDAKSIITSDIFKDKTLTNTYKVTAGVIIAASLGKNNFIGGYNYNDIETLANELNMSVSSVYRHLSVLYQVKVIEKRDFGSYLIKPAVSYVKHFNKNQQNKLNYNKITKTLDQEIEITPEVNSVLDRIYSIL